MYNTPQTSSSEGSAEWTKEEYEELLNDDLQETEYVHSSIEFKPMQTYRTFEHNAPYLTSSSIVKFPDRDMLCMFGGVHMTSRKATNEVWLYDLKKNQWERIRFNQKREKIVRLEERVQYSSHHANKIMNLTPTLRGCEPSPRCGHSAIALSPNEMLIFGGHDIRNQRLLNDCWILKVDNVKTWKLVVPEGRVPIPRWYGSAVKYRDRVYVFGGETEKFRLLNDVNVFSIPDERWLDVRTIFPTPSPRMLHSTTVINGKMYIVGGLGKKNDSETCDIWEFDLTILKWRQIIPRSNVSPFKCYEDDDASARAEKRKMSGVMYASLQKNDDHFDSSELSQMDLSAAEIDLFFDEEDVRSSGSSDDEDSLHGDDFTVEDLEDSENFAKRIIRRREKMAKSKNQQRRLRKRKKSRKRRKRIYKPIYGHCSCPWGNRIVIYGGKRNHKLINEVWMFNLKTEKWRRYYPPTSSTPPKFISKNNSENNLPQKRWKMMNSLNIEISQIFEVSDTKVQKESQNPFTISSSHSSSSSSLRRLGGTSAPQSPSAGSSKKKTKKKGFGQESSNKMTSSIRGVRRKPKKKMTGSNTSTNISSSSQGSSSSSVASRDDSGTAKKSSKRKKKRRKEGVVEEKEKDPVLGEIELLEKFGKHHNIMPFLSDRIMTKRAVDMYIYGGNLDLADNQDTIADFWKMTLEIKQKRHY